MSVAKYNILSLFFCLMLLSLSLALFLEKGFQEAESSYDFVEFEVSAICRSHVLVKGPTSIVIDYLFTSTASGTELDGFLTTNIGDQVQASSYRWDFPQRNWFSVLFEGPPVNAQYYCEPSGNSKEVHLSYYRTENFKISLSNTSHLSQSELDPIQSANRSSRMTVPVSQDTNQMYPAGKGSQTPYWLTFSQEMHSSKRMETTVEYKFE